MNSQTVLIFLGAYLICGSVSQQVVPTGCDYPVQDNFDLNLYMGKWYEIEATNHIEEVGAICVEANYAQYLNGSVRVQNRQVNEATGQWREILGFADPLDPTSSEARFLVNFPSVGAYGAPYWVIDSDYQNYALILSCRPYGDGNSIQTMWFLGRSRNPVQQVRDYVHNRISDLNLDAHLTLSPTVHNDLCNEN